MANSESGERVVGSINRKKNEEERGGRQNKQRRTLGVNQAATQEVTEKNKVKKGMQKQRKIKSPETKGRQNNLRKAGQKQATPRPGISK